MFQVYNVHTYKLYVARYNDEIAGSLAIHVVPTPLPLLALASRWQVYVSSIVLVSLIIPPAPAHHKSSTMLLPSHPHTIHPPHHAPSIMSPRPSHPSSPRRTFGPRPRLIIDILYPLPSLAYFLANFIERVPIARLGPIHRRCIFCQTRMCNEMHLPLPRHPPAPTDGDNEIDDEGQENPPLPPSPSRTVRKHPRDTKPCLPIYPAQIPLPPSHTPDTCPDCRRCEIAIRITVPECGHVIGSRCLVGWLRPRNIKCPICQTLWFRSEDRSWVLVEGWPRPGVMTVAGRRGRVVQKW